MDGPCKNSAQSENTDAEDGCSTTNIPDISGMESLLLAVSKEKASALEPANYVVVDNEEELQKSLKEITEFLQDDPFLAVDCEGDNLSRKGKIQLVSVATRKKVFFIDIQKLKTAPFEIGFRGIFENENISKLMFDCREDSDALFHQFNVKLEGVLDIQLLEVIKRSNGLTSIPSGRRSQRTDEVVKLKGLLKCIEEFIQDKTMVEYKENGLRRLDYWGERPLEKILLKYAEVDVVCLFQLYDKLLPDEEELKRLKIASQIYVDLKRSIQHREFDEYEKNGYLPIDVIPEEGRISFGFASTSCTICNRKFPMEEFSKTQLRKRIQLCRTCKKVKSDIDTQENRMQQSEMEMEYYYESDEMKYENFYCGSDDEW